MYGILQTAFRPFCMNRESVFEWHKKFEECRESVRDDDWCGKSKGVNTSELIGQRIKVRVRVRITMLKFEGSSVRDSVGKGQHSMSVAFPPGQCTSPQIHPCHMLFEQDGHQDSFSPSL